MANRAIDTTNAASSASRIEDSVDRHDPDDDGQPRGENPLRRRQLCSGWIATGQHQRENGRSDHAGERLTPATTMIAPAIPSITITARGRPHLGVSAASSGWYLIGPGVPRGSMA